jgi:hypothetical protein
MKFSTIAEALRQEQFAGNLYEQEEKNKPERQMIIESLLLSCQNEPEADCRGRIVHTFASFCVKKHFRFLIFVRKKSIIGKRNDFRRQAAIRIIQFIIAGVSLELFV